ncbi:MAG TPA: glycosyltransferase [Candidatus Paceibacterota bacterium]|nr:glycosyltransferase [Candidatus Paceibacterota bacterium]
MRVVHVITRLIVGGAQENTVDSVLGLRRKPGLDPRLVSGPCSPLEGSLESRFADCPELLTLLPDLVRPINPWRDWTAYRRLLECFRRQRPDIVHTHSGKAGILGRLAAARARVPLILHTVHGPSFGPFQGPAANWAFRAAERFAAKVTTHFVVVADAMRDQYLQAGIGRPEQYTKILSGFPLEPFLTAANDPALRARLGIAPEDIVVGKIARITRLKGHEDLLAVAPELLREVPRLKFLLVGDGSLRRRVERQVRDAGLQSHFIFAGLVAPGQVPPLVGIMDLVVHLSLREGLPRSLPQALAAGRPVIAYDCDGAREVCLDDQTGFLLPPRDTAGLRLRLLQLARSPELRQRLGHTGRNFVRERFSLDRMVDDLYELYLRLARQRRHPQPA